MFTFLTKAGGQFLPLSPKRSINGHLWLRRFSMGIRVVLIIVFLCSVELWRIPDLDSVESQAWNPFRGGLLFLFRCLLPAGLLINFFRFKSLKFLLTNSRVPRDTKKLVAAVGELKARVGFPIFLETQRTERKLGT
jgi:hypothetical protein